MYDCGSGERCDSGQEEEAASSRRLMYGHYDIGCCRPTSGRLLRTRELPLSLPPTPAPTPATTTTQTTAPYVEPTPRPAPATTTTQTTAPYVEPTP